MEHDVSAAPRAQGQRTKMTNHPHRSVSQKQRTALQWIAARAEYARDFCGDENRKEIMAEIARVAIEALK